MSVSKSASTPKNKNLVGRRSWRPAWPARPDRVLHRRRYFGSKRSVLKLSGQFNPKTLKREVVLTDKKPLFWVFGLFLLVAIPTAVGSERFLSLFGIISRSPSAFPGH
jgi:branched-chain amino acid transport system permease protein